MTTTPRNLDEIRAMPAGPDRIAAIGRYITAGEQKIKDARRLRDDDVRALVRKHGGPAGAACESGLGIHTVKAIARGAR